MARGFRAHPLREVPKRYAGRNTDRTHHTMGPEPVPPRGWQLQGPGLDHRRSSWLGGWGWGRRGPL